MDYALPEARRETPFHAERPFQNSADFSDMIMVIFCGCL
jgi:hypothetical protein